MSRTGHYKETDMEERFLEWFESVRNLLLVKRLIKNDTVLCEQSWKVYYDEGLAPYNAILEDYNLIKVLK